MKFSLFPGKKALYIDVFLLGGKQGEWKTMGNPTLQQAKATIEIHYYLPWP